MLTRGFCRLRRRCGSALEGRVERDLDTGQGLGDRAGRLGLVGRREERGLVDARDLADDGEVDAGQLEPAGRVGAERHVGLDVEGLDGAAGLAEHVGAHPGDCVFFAAGTPKASRSLLGAARLEIGRRCELIDESAWSFLWVIDAPLFEPAADAVAAGDVAVGAGAWTAVHHAFTSPKAEFLDTFDTDPGPALAYAYDMVCNGNEIGGGSIRIHRRDVQERVFEVMGLSGEEAQEKFGFLLDAFQFGAPPHGGIAFGWDRIVMLLGGFDSIRDVIAFPKSGAGYDPLTDAPAPITPEQRKEAGIDSRPPASAPAPQGAPEVSPTVS